MRKCLFVCETDVQNDFKMCTVLKCVTLQAFTSILSQSDIAIDWVQLAWKSTQHR